MLSKTRPRPGRCTALVTNGASMTNSCGSNLREIRGSSPIRGSLCRPASQNPAHQNSLHCKTRKRLNNVKPTQIDQLNDVSGFPHPVLSVSQSGSQLCKPLKSQAQHKRVRFAISVLLQWFPKRVLKITKVVLL
jgi:hypothetical protein